MCCQDVEAHISVLEASASRRKEIDGIRGEIARLSKSLADASDVLPSYDQKSYAAAIKTLTEKLDRTADMVAPRSKFQFKSRGRATVAAMAGLDTRRLDIGHGQDLESAAPRPSGSLHQGAVAAGEKKDYNAEIKVSSALVRKPSFSSAKMITLQRHHDSHIVLDHSAAAATSAGSLQDLRACIVDMSAPATHSPFAGLAIKNVDRCLIVTGNVAGPVHVTGVSGSVLVIASRQVRVHECRDVDMYLHCTSHPIIEDCVGMRFAPIPQCYVCHYRPKTELDSSADNPPTDASLGTFGREPMGPG
jgi:tubulin-specific chaperone C